MEIKKRGRAELKSYFVKNAIPTEGNFSDLIDAALIQKSDGVAKLPGDPLSVEAVGDDNSRKQALSLYRSFTDERPAWSLELSPRGDPADPASGRPGLGFSDGAGQNRLFIDAATGNLGVGTVAPTHILHVKANAAVGLLESTAPDAYLRVQTPEGPEYRVELANRKGGRLALWTRLGGDALSVTRDGRVGVRHDAPQRTLHVGAGGQLSLSQATGVTTDSAAGVFWHTDDNYAIRRSPGPWNAPDFQQLVVDWPTGIVLSPGTGPDGGHARSYVDVRTGTGLRVTSGSLTVGPGEPAGARLRVASAAGDAFTTVFAATGAGELRITGYNNGYALEALGASRHLFLGRGASPSSNVYVGRAGAELQVLANGNVGIGCDPSNFRLRMTSGADGFSTHFAAAGAGELRFTGWASGWNLNNHTDGKHLHIGRDAGPNSNLYLGRNGAEVVVMNSGNVAVGGGDPGSYRLKVNVGGGDFLGAYSAGVGGGELRVVSWGDGWNINTQQNGKHLFLNRDAGPNSSVYIGRANADTVITAAGDVGIGAIAPAARLHVNGTGQFQGLVRVDGGVSFGSGNIAAHIDHDGVLYRFGGQAYLVVDDNFYIRDLGGGIKFHFDTDAGVLRQDPWIGATLMSGWINYASGYNQVAYFRDRQGMVHLRGLLRSGQLGGGVAMFQLPEGFRPPARELRVVLTNDVVGRVDIDAEGRVVPVNVRPEWVSLDGISFRSVQ